MRISPTMTRQETASLCGITWSCFQLWIGENDDPYTVHSKCISHYVSLYIQWRSWTSSWVGLSPTISQLPARVPNTNIACCPLLKDHLSITAMQLSLHVRFYCINYRTCCRVNSAVFVGAVGRDGGRYQRRGGNQVTEHAKNNDMIPKLALHPRTRWNSIIISFISISAEAYRDRVYIEITICTRHIELPLVELYVHTKVCII